MQKVIKVDEETHTLLKQIAAKEKKTIPAVVKQMVDFCEKRWLK